MRPLLLLRLGVLVLAAAASRAADPIPLTRAHAHNDYEHKRPLFEALERGYCSIEADVHLINGELLVAHDAKNAKPGRTLTALYLEPLRQRIHANGGRVYRHGPTVLLYVDIKTEAGPTYAALDALLSRYADVLSEFSSAAETRRALTVVLTGNRDLAAVSAQARRFVVVDGRPDDLDAKTPTRLVPIVSVSWTTLSKWRGVGELPAADRAKVIDLVQRTHAQGRQFRFWATADNPVVWQVLLDLRVDWIGADNLAGLQEFLLARHTP